MNKTEVCTSVAVDYEKVERVKKYLPTGNENSDMADFFKSLADPTRLKIINALAIEELCVCDLSELLDVSVSAISHQLRLLRNRKLVKYRKSGKMVYYRLDDDHVHKLITLTHEHITENEI